MGEFEPLEFYRVMMSKWSQKRFWEFVNENK
jgi:hypothetical protein